MGTQDIEAVGFDEGGVQLAGGDRDAAAPPLVVLGGDSGHAAAHDRLADGSLPRPAGPMCEQVVDGDREVLAQMSGVETDWYPVDSARAAAPET